jgi:hypothetical protein
MLLQWGLVLQKRCAAAQVPLSLRREAGLCSRCNATGDELSQEMTELSLLIKGLSDNRGY